MKIAICGCGIGGLATSIFAKRCGFEVTLYEQFDEPKPVGSGLVIQPVGLNILKQLGVYSNAVATGAKIYQMVGHEAHNGLRVLDVSYGPTGGSIFGLGIHRASLFQILLDAANKEGVKIETGHSVISSHTDTSGRYICINNGRQVGPFDLVIDTMGAGSKISPLRASSLKYGAIWGTVNWPPNTSLTKDQLQQKYLRASHMVGVLPLGQMPESLDQKAALFWLLPRNKIEKWLNTPLDEWRSEALELWPELAPFIEQIITHDQMTPSVYSHGHLKYPFGDKVVHIGDAAHRASPQLGQGANMALLDAAALTQCLTLFPVPTALKTYANSRYLHTYIYQLLSWAFTPMYQSDSRILPILRDRVLGPASKFSLVQHLLTSLVNGTFVQPIRGL